MKHVTGIESVNLPRRKWAVAAPAVACLAWSGPARGGDQGATMGDVVSGSGERDQTEELQAAVDRSGPGGVILQGTIRLSRPVVIRLDQTGFRSIGGDGTARVLMEGAGPAFRFLGTHQGTADPATVLPEVWDRQRMPIVEGIGIEGRHPQAGGIEADGTFGLILSRLHVRQCNHAVHLRGRNRNVILSACHLYHNRGVGVFYDDVDLHQSNIGDCHISYNAGGGIVSRGGNVRNIHIGNCDIEGNHPAVDADPALATANIWIDCRDSEYGTAEVAITGCTIQHTARSPNSANIRIQGGSREELEGHVTISGNVLSDVQVNLHLDSVRGATISGNTLWMGFAHNCLLEKCREIVLAGNNMNRNPRYRHSRAETALHSVVLRECQDITIQGLILRGARDPQGACRIERCRRIIVSGSHITDCTSPHLRVENSTDVVIGDSILGASDSDSPHAIALQLTGNGGVQHANCIFRGALREQ
ncbi:MAG: right-handed parallel beta-helix repeat-containing protein [Planctomycetota bacterium]|nr:MAG: right-handed parallel beta-helix repeat-containing protein [Planctomycetota bacterium]